MRITIKAPLTIIFSVLAIVFYFTLQSTGPVPRVFVLHGDLQFENPLWYVSLVGYTMGHVSINHLVGNISLFLLLGHIIEKRYGTKRMFYMLTSTGAVTALIHIALFDHKLIGASGLVFMMIVLSSLIDIREKEVPISFILIVLLFIGKEVVESFESDAVSQFAHIFGGVMGAFFGYRYKREGIYR